MGKQPFALPSILDKFFSPRRLGSLNCIHEYLVEVLSVDTNILRHLPRRSSKNSELQFANCDRFKENYTTINLYCILYSHIFSLNLMFSVFLTDDH